MKRKQWGEEEMHKILIIEDTQVIREELKTFLLNYGYEVEALESFENILGAISHIEADLILLDINLPLYDGYYICREIRKTSQVPIIIVTSRDSEMDELMSMNFGADDFVTKPYNTQILLARIASVLKRTYGANTQGELLNYNGLTLNLGNGTVSYQQRSIELTKNEYKILGYLMKNKGSIIAREELMEVLWKSELFIDDNTLSVNVNRLRKKIEDLGVENPIETRRGLGYIMP
ncbi:MAG: response regulator transcription factor [Cellulosilyticaceae bacterium]